MADALPGIRDGIARNGGRAQEPAAHFPIAQHRGRTQGKGGARGAKPQHNGTRIGVEAEGGRLGQILADAKQGGALDEVLLEQGVLAVRKRIVGTKSQQRAVEGGVGATYRAGVLAPIARQRGRQHARRLVQPNGLRALHPAAERVGIPAVMQQAVVVQRHDGVEHIGQEDGHGGEGAQVEVGAAEHIPVQGLATGREQAVEAGAGAARQLVVGDDPSQKAEVRHVVVVPVDTVDGVFPPFHGVVTAYLGGIDSVDQLLYPWQRMVFGVGIDAADVGQCHGGKAQRINGPFAAIHRPKLFGHLDQQPAWGHDHLLAEPFRTAKELGTLGFPRNGVAHLLPGSCKGAGEELCQ